MSERRLSIWDIQILLATVGMNGESYGASIAQYIEEATGRSVAVQTIYDALDALEKKELVKAQPGPSSPQRGGRARLLIRVTHAGEAALRQHLEELDQLRRRCGETWEFSNA